MKADIEVGTSLSYHKHGWVVKESQHTEDHKYGWVVKSPNYQEEHHHELELAHKLVSSKVVNVKKSVPFLRAESITGKYDSSDRSH